MDNNTKEIINEEIKEEEISMESCEEIKRHKLCLLRSFVEAQDPSSKEVDDHVLNRFLHYRKLDVEKASESFLKYLKWRKAFVPNGYISESEIRTEISQKKLFMQGFDKKGRPLVVVFHGRHVVVKKKERIEEFKRFMVYCMDKVCARMRDNGQEQFSFISDFAEWGLSKNDINGCLTVLSILQDFYPETLAQVYIVNQPYLLNTIWKIVSPLIRNNTKEKFVFVDNKKVTSRLLQDIDMDQLPEIYGGKLPLVPVEEC
ncbi:Phosphatidylinositol transfer protein [Thalictrum thalictroides]|uniref:Phosphatidylinositol transfer protein n=1 Tax=Thalictrum thalictroides TaxID=46969 RepID=A0A7J6WML5_THATH|nr:Phosphatidylinositol transfer protein [Thalictrum thalictroides]